MSATCTCKNAHVCVVQHMAKAIVKAQPPPPTATMAAVDCPPAQHTAQIFLNRRCACSSLSLGP